MNVWRAMARNPLRFVFSSWPWRSLLYLATGPIVAAVWLGVVCVLVVAGVLLTPLVVGVGLLACVPLSAVALAAVERWRLRLIDPRPAPSPHRVPPRPGLWGWARFRLREPVTWRELGSALLGSLLACVDFVVPFVLIVGSTVAMSAPNLVSHGDQVMFGSAGTVDTPQQAWPLAAAGAGVLLVGFYAFTALAGGRAALARALLVRPADEELVEVRASRARMADAFEAERRRIERDLHDGAQQRLTALIMTLGLAKLDGGAAPGLIDRAQAEARAALEELRDLVRGIHPSVLTDRGLPAAVDSLAERSSVPVDVDVDLPERPPEHVESTAYFVIAEALANVAKHSGATRARVHAHMNGGTLAVQVWDDGAGGATPDGDGGLRGLADRVAVYDGTLRLSSPPGGPTILRVEIPCAS